MTQHLHNKIGNMIGEAKRRLFDKLTAGADLEDTIAVFVAEIRLGLETIVREEKLKAQEHATIQ